MRRVHEFLRFALPLIFGTLIFYISLELKAPAVGRGLSHLANRPVTKFLLPEASYATNSMLGSSLVELTDGMTYFLAAFLVVFLLLSKEKRHQEIALAVLGMATFMLLICAVVT